MLEPYTAEIRQELAAARMAALRHSARPSAPGLLRRTVGDGLVRLGLHLGGAGSVPPVDLRTESAHTEALAPAGASDPFSSVPRVPVRATRATYEPLVLISSTDIARELAAPYGLRSARPAPRRRRRSGAHPGARSARYPGSRLAIRFDAT